MVWFTTGVILLMAFASNQVSALSGKQRAAARVAFNAQDQDSNHRLTPGGVYAALFQLDPKLTEQQLDKASKIGTVSMLRFMS